MNLLLVLLFLTETEEQRETLQEKDCFSLLMKTFTDSVQERDFTFVHPVIASLAHFSYEKP